MEKENLELRKRLIQFDEVIKMTQNLNSELQKKNENLEIENRTLEEDFHTLKDNYDNLKKRFEQLQKEISEVKNNNNKKSSMFGWIMNSGQKEEIESMRDKIITLESELQLKIQENEQIHIEIFEEKQNFNKIITNLECEVEKMKLMINDKVAEIHSVNDKNSFLINTQKKLEASLNQISESLKNTENELLTKISKWKVKKELMKKEIFQKERLTKNLLSLNDFKIEKINYLNQEFFNNFSYVSDYSNKSFRLVNNIIKDLTKLLNQSDSVIINLIERYNYIYQNIDLKTEHRGYLYICDKLRFHSFTLSQMLKTSYLLLKTLKKKIETVHEEKSFVNILLLINIILTLLNKSTTYIILLSKYFKVLLKEERKISYNEVLDVSVKQQINKSLKNSIQNLTSIIQIMMKKVNLVFHFDLDYNLKNIQIMSDNTSGIVIKVSKDYFKNYKNSTILKIRQKVKLLNSIKDDFLLLKNYFLVFVKNIILKSDIEYKFFEVIKEENKNKYNYPIINLTAFKLNNDNLKSSLQDLSETVCKMTSFYFEEADSINSISSMYFCSWDIDGLLFIPFLSFLVSTERIAEYNKIKIEDYQTQQEGVDYQVAMRNKAALQEMLEKENLLSRDRENYLNKIKEYEEDIERYRNKLTEEQNLNDLMKLQMANSENRQNNNQINSHKNSDNSSSLNIATITNSQEELYIQPNEFEDFLQNQINFSDLRYEILSDDVQSGKQRSSFKLTEPSSDKAIPLTKFTAQIEKDSDVTILYHRKLLEKLHRYAGKVKSFDLKVMSAIQTEEINKEFENKFSEAHKKFQEQIDYLSLQLEQKDNNIIGYTQTIEFLSEAHTSLELLKDNIKDCAKCKKFIQ
jgi:hypothetical protein